MRRSRPLSASGERGDAAAGRRDLEAADATQPRPQGLVARGAQDDAD